MKHLIIGGSGTLGTALTERLYGKHQITCFSRGELAQKTLKSRFPDVRMVIGDVRDRDAVTRAMAGHDTVFLLAAIKHIDIAEQNPLEAVKTNVHGAVNVGDAALAAGVNHVIYSNTDKAVLPVSTYGYTKALAQNFLLSLNGGKTKFSAFNWGNVIASRGSVIQTFVDKLLRHELVPLTDPRMTRFWLTMDQAADFMLENYHLAPTDRAMIPPIKGASVARVVQSVARILGIKGFLQCNIGHRGIEKLHEVLESTHEGCLRSDTCEQYTDAELDELLGDSVRRLANAQKTADSGGLRGHGEKVLGNSKASRSRVPGDRPGRQVAGA